MRIRKHTKLCGGGRGSVLFGLDDNFQTHVCQLNQSPWDVIPFGSDSSLQFDGDEDSFTGNGSRGDSVGAVESVASIMDAENQTKPFPKVEDRVVVHDNEAKVLEDIDEGRVVDETISFCQKTDGKNWHCKNEAKPGQSFCDHHLPLLRSYNNNNSVSYNSNNTSSSKKAAAAASSIAAAGVRRGKARAAKRASSSSSSLATSNLYEFYYYSGFGPSWGKRRGDRHGEGSNNNHRSKNEQQMKGVENSSITEAEEANEEATQKNTPSPSSSSSSSQMMDNEEFDYGVDDDDEDEYDEEEEANGDSGKKRMRKPVKARSLKSLM